MLRDVRGKWGKGLAVALAVSGLLLFAGCGNKQAQQKAPAAVAVKTMQVIKRDTPNVHEFTGFVEAQQEAFTIDQRTYQANLLNAQAGLAAARTEYNRLVADAERYKKLYEQNAVSKQQYDLSIAQRDSAQAQVTAHEAILENARINMGDTEVKAPFSGRISTSDLSVGNFVAAGQTVLATMSNTNPVRIKFSMSENEYLQLSKAHSDSGAKALEDLKLILSDGSVYTGAGVVDQVDREIGSGTGALTLKARFSNDNNRLMPGMFARLQANAGTIKNAMLIPCFTKNSCSL